jgi:hypothetical protein
MYALRGGAAVERSVAKGGAPGNFTVETGHSERFPDFGLKISEKKFDKFEFYLIKWNMPDCTQKCTFNG